MIVYIHGASATAESFSYIRQYVREETELPDICLEYDSSLGFEHNYKQMLGKLDEAERIFFVSHSLGGIYALHLANYYNDRTVGGISLSTPYGGCVQADFAKYFLPYSRLLKDIGPRSYAMKNAQTIDISIPWTNIVTVKGNAPWVPQPNDGVVTIASQKSRPDIMELIEIDYNHYEVVLSDNVVELIKERLPK